MTGSRNIAVLLFNLGGPDTQEAVKPFLFNLFNDKAIISLPNPFRFFLAKLISGKREKEAQEIYEQIGGKSPILELTQAQCTALESRLNNDSKNTHKVWPVMRYWHPFAKEIVSDVMACQPDEVWLVPLYPQFSTTTSNSSIRDWLHHAQKAGLTVPTKIQCCYPTQPDFIAAHASLIRPAYEEAAKHGTPRILFSAHGLPKKVIDKGDPYQWQVEQTAQAVVDALAIEGLDWQVCYQSKVGPLEWIGPATDAEILRAAESQTPIVIVPIAFVSEHSETLVELDIQYKQLAADHGLTAYYRVPALGTHEQFIQSLATLCTTLDKTKTSDDAPLLCSPKGAGQAICPHHHRQCPHHQGGYAWTG